MRRLTTIALAVVAIGLVAFATFKWAAPTQPALTKVTVAQVGEFFLYLPIYVAQDKGFFEREGITVAIANTGGDEKSVAAVINGSADFGVGDPTFAAIAASRGQGVSVIASVVNGVPFWGITKKQGVPEINEPSTLKGLVVATFPSPSTAYTLQASMFRAGGLEPNIRQAQFGTLLSLLGTPSVDIVLELEPNVSTAVAEGARVVYSMAQRYGDFAITGVTVANDTKTKRPQLVQGFVRALNNAENYCHEKPDELVAYAQKRFPTLKPSIVEAAVKRVLASRTLPQGAAITVDAWKKALQLRVSAGELPSVEASLSVLDNTFASNLR